MPPQPMAGPPDTPKRVRHSFEKVIQSLNARFSLDLPTVHGTQEAALEHANSAKDLARQCAGRLRYLCYRECELERVISDFEDDVPRLCSEWVWKPSQEPGTLPKLPVTKSFVSTTRAPPRQSRQLLLQRLFDLLNEEFKLARESEAYSRTSFSAHLETDGTNARIASPMLTHGPANVKAKMAEVSEPKDHKSTEGVKRKSSESRKSKKSPKKQMTLSQMDMFRRLSGPDSPTLSSRPVAGTSSTNIVQPSHQSVSSTTDSNAPQQIFTQAATEAGEPHTSAETSVLEGSTTSSPDLFPTQDAKEIEEDESFTTSFNDLSRLKTSDSLFHHLCQRTPFKNVHHEIPHKLTFRNLYEVERLADAFCITPRELLNDFRKKGISSETDYSKFWEAARGIAKDRGKCLPEKPSSAAWESASGSFFAAGRRQKSVYLAGALKFKEKGNDGFFDLRLKPFQLDTSCRFHRKYGPSRFMVVSLPSLTSQVPSRIPKLRGSELVKSMGKWLATDHYFLGRKWKAFFVEAEKRKKKKVDEPARGHKVHLFAVSGEDMPSGSVTQIEQLFEWHVSVQHNLKSTNLKLFQRLSLGLSKTLPSVVLDASDFIRLPDPVDHAVMNDGCARMSKTLAKAISQEIGLGEVPSAFQGRIAGAKGLWMVVPDQHFSEINAKKYCLEVADSQLKIKPHPKDDPSADEEKRRFEVLKCSGPGKPSSLNIQLIGILHERGVPRHLLGNLLITDMRASYQELEKSVSHAPSLRAWFQSNGTCSREEEQIKMTGSMPDNAAEQAMQLIEAGFEPGDSSELWDRLREVLAKYLGIYVDRLPIRIACSTYLFCIADPYGVLEPNEVHIAFSEVWKDPASGFKESFVGGRDVLVARLPAYLPSDIQRRQAVWRPELHHFKDVIVFSTKGDTPLAELLSGGDYDGDTPWICWDPEIVQRFANADVPDMPSKEQFLTSCNQRVEDIFSSGGTKGQFASQLETFFADCFTFNLHTSHLGQCSLEHEKVVYFEDGGHSGSNAIMLAALCGVLVDSPKQGYLFTQDNFHKLLKKVSPNLRGKPAYKEGSEERPRQSCIIDDLKFWWAEKEKGAILKEFHKRWPKIPKKDSILCQPWTSMLSNCEKAGGSTHGLRRVLEHLLKNVEAIAEAWSREVSKYPVRKADHYRLFIENLYSEFRAIRPLEATHTFTNLWQLEEAQGKICWHWSSLRASCVYNKYFRSTMAWKLAGQELCRIKAEANATGCRMVINNIYPLLKSDKKMTDRARLRLDGMSFEESLGSVEFSKAHEMDEGDF